MDYIAEKNRIGTMACALRHFDPQKFITHKSCCKLSLLHCYKHTTNHFRIIEYSEFEKVAATNGDSNTLLATLPARCQTHNYIIIQCFCARNSSNGFFFRPTKWCARNPVFVLSLACQTFQHRFLWLDLCAFAKLFLYLQRKKRNKQRYLVAS